MIRVGGLTYWEIKQKALNGHRSKLSAEQLGFVGFESPEHEPVRERTAWLQPVNPSTIDQRLAELAEARDIAPGWYELARRIVKDE